MTAPLFIAVAPTGARKTRADHPRLPMTPAEIAAVASEVLEAGAAMLHLHVRDREGRHTLDTGEYAAATAAIYAAVGDRLMIQVSTEAVGRYSPAEQMAAVKALKPEAVSLSVRELIPDASAEKDAAAFLLWCRRENVSIQYIIYDGDDLRRFADVRARGIVPGLHPFRLFVLGRYTGAVGGKPSDLVPFLAGDPEPEDPWMVCAFGRYETACATVAAALGGHARVGFENNLRLPDGRLADSNAELVAAVVNTADALAQPLGNAEGLRAAMADWR